LNAPGPVRTRSPERLAYWYFRLNGFLTTENFVIHPDVRAGQRTDADLIATRFKHRSEGLMHEMEDDPRVVTCGTLANVVIAEIKKGACALNGPWTRPVEGNMRRVMKAIGCASEAATDLACEALHKRGTWSDDAVTVRLFAVGESRSQLSIPQDQQLTWSEIAEFCIGRFKAYRRQKADVEQWQSDGRLLQKRALGNEPEAGIRAYFHLNPLQAPD
jgi:hypothetical protein